MNEQRDTVKFCGKLYQLNVTNLSRRNSKTDSVDCRNDCSFVSLAMKNIWIPTTHHFGVFYSFLPGFNCWSCCEKKNALPLTDLEFEECHSFFHSYRSELSLLPHLHLRPKQGALDNQTP